MPKDLLKWYLTIESNHLLLFIVIILAGNCFPVKKNMKKTSQRITEIEFFLEFARNPRNFSQGMITGLLRAWNIFIFLFEGITPRSRGYYIGSK